MGFSKFFETQIKCFQDYLPSILLIHTGNSSGPKLHCIHVQSEAYLSSSHQKFSKLYFNYCFSQCTCYSKKTCQDSVFKIFLKVILGNYTSLLQILTQTSEFVTRKGLDQKLQTSTNTLSSFSLKSPEPQTHRVLYPVLRSCSLSVF